MTENDAAEEKKRIRARALKRRDALSDWERERGAVLLTERILGHQWFYGSHTLLAFASYGSEIDTGEIIDEALRLGKRVYLPRVMAEDGRQEMEFFRIASRQELRPGYRGILEPSPQGERYVYREGEVSRVLLLMPGVAFDGYRNRIGYGKGFYDRYLAGKADLRLRSVAVGFQCQLMEERLPCDERDAAPYQVICV